MAKRKNHSRTRGLVMLGVCMLIGGFIGYTSSSGSFKLPSDLNLKASYYYDYDLLFGSLALTSLILVVWNTIGLKQINRLPSEPEQEELINPQEQELSKITIISSYSQIVSFLWLVLSFTYAREPAIKNLPTKTL